MAKFYNLYIWLISYILTKYNSNGQNYYQQSSPCPNIYQYNSQGYASIMVPSPDIFDTLLLQVEFIIFGTLDSKDVGSLNLSRSQQETLQSLLNGASYINYVLRFPPVYNANGLPQIIQINQNGNIICSGSLDGAVNGPRTNIKLQNYFYSERPFRVNRNNANNFNTQPQIFSIVNDKNTFDGNQFNNINNNNNRPQFFDLEDEKDDVFEPTPINVNKVQFQQTQPILVQRPNVVQQNNNVPERPAQPVATPTPTTLPSNVRDEDICGTIDQRLQSTPLVFGGRNIIHGSWPWLAAIFVSNGHSLNYQCGGSLVSNRVVVSAAHCFVIGGSKISSIKVNVHLGRHNLNIWEEEGQQRREVSLIKVHDDYMRTDTGSFDADIAVAVLKRVVEYTKYVRPICLWSGNTELRQIENQAGTVVGWGLTETGSDETEPKAIDVPIVSQETCLRASDAFTRITSNRTFCAGSKDGTGPCNGDSGSGFAIKQNSRWALRGIVSVSATSDTVHRKCDLSQFVVFTDAALFRNFINENIT